MMKKLLAAIPGVRRLLIVSIALGMAGGALLIVESAGLARIAAGAFMEGRPVAALLPLFGLLLALIGLRAAVHAAGEAAAAQLALRVKTDLRRRLLRKLSELGPHYVRGERSGELLGTAYEGVEQLETYLARYMPQMALSMLVPAAMFAVVAGLDGLSALVLAVTLPLLVLFMILVGVAAKGRAEKQFRTLGRLGGHFLDVLRGLPTLKMFNRSRAQIDVIGRISEEYRRTTLGTLRLAFLSAFVMELFATLSTAIVAVFLGLRLIAGEIGFEHAFLVLLLTPEYYAPVRALGTQFHASASGVAAARRILELLDAEPPGWTERPDTVRLAARPEGCRIELTDVTVHYPGESAPALANITLTLSPGERLAVIGPTGAGKSTLLDVLQGFVRPSSGTVRVDGIDMAELSMAWWREQLSTVAQQPRFAHGTVRDNVTPGSAAADEAQLAAALRTAGVDFLDALPQGLDTPLGEAVRLSGGQAQRLAIARALLRPTPLLLLDEPTNALDLEHEATLREGLGAALQGRMSVTVAHRLDTVRSADRILVLAGGRVAELGAPAELLAAGGLYARMARAQAPEERAEGAARGGAGEPRGGAGATPWPGRPDAGEAPRERASEAAVAAAAANAPRPPAEATRDAAALPGRVVFRRMLSFIPPYRWRMALAALLGFATVAANVGLMGTSGYLIARAALRPETVLLLWVPIVGVRFFGLSRGVFRYVERLVSHDLTFRVLHRVRVWLYERLEPGGVTLLERRRSGDVLGALLSDVEQLQHMVLRVLAPPLIAGLTAALGVIVMAAHHWTLAALLGGMMLLTGVGIPWLSLRLGRKDGEGIVRTRARLHAELAEFLTGLKEWTAFGQVEARLAKLDALQEAAAVHQAGQHRQAAWSAGAMLGAAHLTMWLMLLASTQLAATGRLAAVSIPALAMIALACFEPVTPLPAAFQQLGQTLAAARRLFRLADGQPSAPAPGAQSAASQPSAREAAQHSRREARRYSQQEAAPVSQAGAANASQGTAAELSQPEATQLAPVESGQLPRHEAMQPAPVESGQLPRHEAMQPAPAESAQLPRHEATQPLPGAALAAQRSGRWTLRVQGLSFRYGPEEPYALRHLSLTLAAGQRVAVVGESGAGKSTLLDVLLKLRPYDDGVVAIGGDELRELPEEAVRAQFSVVSQQVQLFNASVAANIRLGAPQASDAEVREAARLAMVDETFSRLPAGYDTIVGEWGARLSGGERQRLALARALVRDTPAILFDEPATGLDALTEHAFLRQMDDALRDKAVLWITHRLKGLERMDEIIVMQHGAVRERGTHAELLERKGYYARLWQLEREQQIWETLQREGSGA